MEAETAGSALSDLLPADVYATSTKAVTFGESAANITGIQKTGDYSMRVVLTEVSATAVYQLGVVIAPMHYYGEKDKYDYANNKFRLRQWAICPTSAPSPPSPWAPAPTSSLSSRTVL